MGFYETSTDHARPQPEDRCPYSARGTYAECRTHQPVTLLATTSLGVPLTDVRTCVHLTVGEDLDRTGRFYPRCTLGGRSRRLAWLADVGPERLELARDLQRRFDLATAAARQRLMAARARVLAEPRRGDLRRSLAAAARAFAKASEQALRRDAIRYQRAAMTPDAVRDLVRRWLLTVTAVGDGRHADVEAAALIPSPAAAVRMSLLPSA